MNYMAAGRRRKTPWLRILLMLAGVSLFYQLFSSMLTLWSDLLRLGDMTSWSRYNWLGFAVGVLSLLCLVRFGLSYRHRLRSRGFSTD